MPSTFTTEIYLEEPGLGDYTNDWNVPVNSNFTIIDAAIGGSTSVAFTNANVTLSVPQSAYFSIVCTGTLTANVALILPATIGGTTCYVGARLNNSWDREFEADVKAGKLDALGQEADKDFEAGRCKPL